MHRHAKWADTDIDDSNTGSDSPTESADIPSDTNSTFVAAVNADASL